MALVEIKSLTPLTTPTTGWVVPLQKTVGETAKSLDLKLLQSYDTGSGFVGCYTERQRLGAWNMKTAIKHTLNLTDPSSIIAIEPSIIISDDNKQYPYHSVYDSYYYQNDLESANGMLSAGGTSGNVTSGNSSDSSSGTTGTGNTGSPLLLWAGTVGSGASYFKFMGTIDVSVSIESTSIRVTHNQAAKTVRCFLSAINNDIDNVRVNAVDYSTDSFLIRSALATQYYVEIYSMYDYDAHTHAIGSHSHSLIGSHTHSLSVSGGGSFSSGFWGKNVSVNYQWLEGAAQVELTHNNLGSADAIATAFGTITGYTTANVMNNFQTAANRGYINIIRKFTA